MYTHRLKVVLVLTLTIGLSVGAQTIDDSARRRAEELVSKMTLEEKLSYIGGDESDFGLRPIDRLGIPAIKMSDGPQGVNDKNDTTILYPCGIALASTWNKVLAYRYGESLGSDARARGVHIMLGPGVNIYRYPLCGRNFEYFGEDPYLTSETAVEYIKGLQSNEVIATIKHFCGNNSEWSRHNSSSDIDERTLNEVYFPAFRKAVKEAGVGAVMSSYNLVNSLHTTESPYLAQTILRDTWGFDGIYMSDWAATYSGVAAANAGLDLEMPNAMYMNKECMLQALQNGTVTEKVIDKKCIHILQTLISFGFFDREQKDASIPMYNPESHQTALDVAREAIVLLKNDDDILPFNKKVKKVAVLGPNSDRIVAGGGSGHAKASTPVTVYDGLASVSKKLEVVTDPECAEVVVYCAGFDENLEKEGRDRSFCLPKEQIEEIHRLDGLAAKLVVIVNAGGGVDFTQFEQCADALLMAWYPGQVGGQAIAEILTGKVNPSGRLPISIERSLEDNPAHGSYYANEFKQLKSPYDRIRYKEGVFIGYRGYDKNDVRPLYPFGYGLSYTSFEYTDPQITQISDNSVKLTFKVRNTGKVTGKTVAQIYVGQAQPSVPRPQKELKAYEKLELKPGEVETVELILDAEAFEYYDMDKHQFVMDKGKYVIYVGDSSKSLPLKAEIEIN